MTMAGKEAAVRHIRASGGSLFAKKKGEMS